MKIDIHIKKYKKETYLCDDKGNILVRKLSDADILYLNAYFKNKKDKVFID